MLRVRRGPGLSANLSHICRPYLRCAPQCFPRRAFATEADPDSAKDAQSSSADQSEDILKGLEAESKKLRIRIREMKKEADKMKAKKAEHRKKQSRKAAAREAKAGKSDEVANPETDVKPEMNSNFQEALGVVRRIYGVEAAAGPSNPPSNPPSEPPSDPPKDSPKKKKGEPRKKVAKLAAEEVVETPAKDDNADGLKSWTVAEQAGMWTSLRERLQHQTSQRPRESEDDQGPMFQYAQQDLSLGPDAASFISGENQRIPPTIKLPHDPIPEFPNDTEPVKGTKRARKTKKAIPEVEIKVMNPRIMKLTPVEQKLAAEVPKLEYHLDKVLFNPGVYHLQDERSKVFNFDPYLATIMPVEQFDFNALKEYVTSSKDTRLRDLSAKHGKKFCGSTSSMTSMLAHFHFLLSAWRSPSFEHLSRSFNVEYESFTNLSRGPAAAFARYKDGVYAIDADKEYDTANVLSMLGKSMEKLLTLPTADFEKYRRTRSHQLSEEEKNAEEAFHYSTFGDFMLRSQLDAHDPRLPGTGMFDLKTRAVVSIRMDVSGYEKGVGYEIRNRFGTWESFEREYYDMIRAAFLKYSLQVRMGRMDGIFVAFHNTQRIFGFQYISLEEMDRALHGTSDRSVGDQEFKASLTLLNDVLNRAAKRFPERSLRLHVETRPTTPPLTYVFAQPVDEEEINKTQATGQASVDAFEREILGLSRKEKEEEAQMRLKADLVAQAEKDQLEQEDSQDSTTVHDPQRQKAWDEMMAKVDETVENDSLGLQTVRDAIEQALEQSGLLAGNSDVEKNAYLNALVEALYDELSGVKELCKGTEGEPQSVNERAQPEDLEKANETSQEKPEPAAVQEETIQTDELSGENNSPHEVDSSQSSSPAAAEEGPKTMAEGSEVVTEETSTAVDATSTEDGSAVVDSPSAEGYNNIDATSTEEGFKVADATSTEGGSAVVDSGFTEGSDAVNTTSTEEGSSVVGTEVYTEATESTSTEDANTANTTPAEMISEAVGEQAGSVDNNKLSEVSLKDLILKVAQNVDHKASSSSMGTFGRVLSELVQAQKQASAEIDDVDEDVEVVKGEFGATAIEESAESSEANTAAAGEEPSKKGRELFGMYITVRNKVDDQVVERVDQSNYSMANKSKWTVEYAVTELPQGRAVRILDQLRARRRKILQSDPEERSKQWYRAWSGDLARSTRAGQRYRKGMSRDQKGRGVKVAWTEKKLSSKRWKL